MDNFSLPKISIITANLNGEATLERTIQSIIHQSYQNLEYLVIDGGSTDGSLNIINRYADLIDVVLIEKDKGISDAFNKGIERTTGDLIGIVSADDYLPEGSLQAVAKVWLTKQDVDVIYGNSIVYEPGNTRQFIVKPDKDFRAIWRRQPLKHSAMYVSRKTYSKFGMYNLKYHLAMDYELTLRFYLKNASFVYINKVIGAFCIGGINDQNFVKTMAEVRDISIHYGYLKIKAHYWFFIKVIKLYIKKLLYRLHLFSLIKIYRNFSSRFKKLI